MRELKAEPPQNALEVVREELARTRNSSEDPMMVLLWSVDWLIEERLIMAELLK